MNEQKRKPGRPKGPATIPVCIRMPVSQYGDYLNLGGAKWIKGLLNLEIQRQQKEKL